MTSPLPYQILHQKGELKRRAEILRQKLNSCTICPRHCNTDRRHEVEGFCRSGRNPLVASTVAHFGEEPALVGKNGAGNIFFGSCNLRCVYCQNWQISHPSNKSQTTFPSPLVGEGVRRRRTGEGDRPAKSGLSQHQLCKPLALCGADGRGNRDCMRQGLERAACLQYECL